MSRGWPWPLLAWLAAGCSESLPPESRIDKLRLLAIRAEPPEVSPGGSSVLDALVASPPPDPGQSDPLTSYLWLACAPVDGTASATGSAIGACAYDGTSNIPLCAETPAAPICLLGASPSVTYAAAANALGASPARSVVITMIVADASVGGAIGCAMSAAGHDGVPTDPDHCLIGVKQLTISCNPIPNHNPRLYSLALDGVTQLPWPFALDGPDTVLAARRCPASLVGHSPLCPTGSGDEREPPPGAAPQCTSGTTDTTGFQVESQQVSYYASAGTLGPIRAFLQPDNCTGDCLQMPLPEVTRTVWTPPASDEASYVHNGLVRFFVVLRDDRGGVDWLVAQAKQQ